MYAPYEFGRVIESVFTMSRDMIIDLTVLAARDAASPSSLINAIRAGEPVIDVFAEFELQDEAPVMARIGLIAGVDVLAKGFAPSGFPMGTQVLRDGEPWPTTIEAAREFIGPERLSMASVRVRFREQGAVTG
ncbi:hypothetical protein [Actinoallomurus sp. NPDC052274]|uniref:hypothetical protein n=1 Tax=Actinoallomurus sp. NPDC052274 TaxID=3155420 RepID=UPI00342925CD